MNKFSFKVTYFTKDRLLFDIKTKPMYCEFASVIDAVKHAFIWVKTDFNSDDSVARVPWCVARIDVKADYWEHPTSYAAQVWARPEDL